MKVSASDSITLTPHNLFFAGLVGVSRHVKDLGRKTNHGADKIKDGFQNDCVGACGEMVVAKWLDAFWDGAMGNFRAKDAGGLQVRTSTLAIASLILHPEDQSHDIFILVLAHQSPTFRLAGWLHGLDGKNRKYWRDGQKGRPAFFVPQADLKPMAELRSLLNGGPGPDPSPYPVDSAEKNRVYQSLQSRLNGVYGIDRRWTYAEESMLAELSRVATSEAELTTIIAFRESISPLDRARFFPQSVHRLLETWSQVLDRAKVAAPRHGRAAPATADALIAKAKDL